MSGANGRAISPEAYRDILAARRARGDQLTRYEAREAGGEAREAGGEEHGQVGGEQLDGEQLDQVGGEQRDEQLDQVGGEQRDEQLDQVGGEQLDQARGEQLDKARGELEVVLSSIAVLLRALARQVTELADASRKTRQ